MKWKKRLKQWLAVLNLEHRSAGRLPWLTMFVALLSGPVPAAIWRKRMRACMTCELYSTHQMPGTTKRTDRLHVCKSSHPDMLGIGCGCAVNIAALTANPHGKGCFGRDLEDSIGWPAYHDLRPRSVRILDFLRGK